MTNSEQNILKWTLREVLGALPEKRDWLNPDAERQMRTILAELDWALREVWQPMKTAPKDGTMLRLLVQFDDNATEDSAEPCATIGANNFDHDQTDEWKFAGWNWSHDCFTDGVGTPVGWLPMVNGERIAALAMKGN